MRQLKHENIIDIMEIFIPQEYKGFSDVYVVSSLMETDLTCARDMFFVPLKFSMKNQYFS